MKGSYGKIALVAHRRHVESLDSTDDILLVSSNWLLWQECLDQGLPCVHIDRGLSGWDDAYALGNSLYLRSNDWMFVGENNMTLFLGVSLGDTLNNPIAMMLSDFEKISQSIKSLIIEFKPTEIIFFDCLTDYGYLDIPGRRAAIEHVAERCDVKASDRTDPLGSGEPGFPMIEQSFGHDGCWIVGRRPTGSIITNFIVRAFETTVTALGLIRMRLSASRPGILVITTQLNGIPLLKSFNGEGVFAQYIAGWWPNKKNPLNLLKLLWKGVLPADGWRKKLTPAEDKNVARIREELSIALKKPACVAEAQVYRLVRGMFIDGSILTELAEQVIWMRSLMDSFKPVVVVTDGLRNITSLTALTLAKQRGKSTFVTWHAPHAQDTGLNVFGCDSRSESLADITLTWGSAHERWLKNIGAKTTFARTGSAVSYGRGKPAKKRNSNEFGKNALILQYFLNYSDYRTPPSYEYYFFISVVRMLNELGYSDICLKIHPGAPKERYYEKIAKVFGVNCTITRNTDLNGHIEWADIAIGPPSSGSMFMVANAGVPFYPVLLPPHSMNIACSDGAKIFDDLDDLREAIMINRAPNLSTLLNDFTSVADIPDPPHTIWSILKNEALRGEG